MRRLSGLTLTAILLGWLAPLALAQAVKETPFQIHANVRVASAPRLLRIETRYDVDRVQGQLCLIVDGEEFHLSCWDAESVRVPPPVEVRLTHAGEYAVQMVQQSGNGKRKSNVEQLLLQ